MFNTAFAAAAVLLTAGSALARDDRPLPPADSLAVGIDDALAGAERSYPRAKTIDARITRHRGQWVYQFKLASGKTVRTVKVECDSGDRVFNRKVTVRGARLSNVRNDVQVLNTVAATRLDAIKAAEAAVPGARAYEVEFDDLNDAPVWKVKLLDGDRRVTVIVSASAGVVLPMPGDGVVDLTFDDAATRAAVMFPGWTVVKVELDDDRNFDDSGDYYNIRMTDGAQRRDIQLDANTGSLRRDRIQSVSDSNASEYAQIVAAGAPAIGFTEAAMKAVAARPGSRVHELHLKIEHGVLVYEVELTHSDGTQSEIYVNAATGQIGTSGSSVGGNPGNPGNPNPTPGPQVTQDQAVAIALTRFPGYSVRELESEIEHGALVWKVKLEASGDRRAEVRIDAATGAIVRIRND